MINDGRTWPQQQVVAIAVGCRLDVELQRLRHLQCRQPRRRRRSVQEVDDVSAADDLLIERRGTGRAHGLEAVHGHHRQDVDELTVTVGVLREPLPHPRHRRRQVPVLERRAIPERAGLALQCRHVVPRVVARLAPVEAARVIADDGPAADHDDSLGVATDRRNLSDVAAFDAVAVAIEVNEAGRRHAAGLLGIAVERRRRRSQGAAFLVPDVDDRALGLLRVHPFARELQAARGQMRVELGQIRAFDLRCEQPLPDVPHLVLDLTLLPARCRRTCRRLDQVVVAHRQEAAVVAPLATDEDRVDRRLQVVVDPAARHAAKEHERPRMRVEHHLLTLAGIRRQEERATVAQPHVRDLDDLRDTAKLDVLVAPVELVGLARIEALRDERGCDRPPSALDLAHVPANAVDGARITLEAQRLVDPLRRPLLPGRKRRLGLEPAIQHRHVVAELRHRLSSSAVLERLTLDLQRPLDRVARKLQIPRNTADRLTLYQPPAPNLPDRFDA